MAKGWFVIHTYSQYEEKVKEALENKRKALGLEEKIMQIVIPTEEVIDIKNKKKVVMTRKIYPGYLLVEMDMDNKIWHVVRSTPGVTGFVGPGKRPITLNPEEVEGILQRKEKEATQPVPRIQFEKGETVRITDGPFTNFTGTVEEINLSRGKIKVFVTIFGRATPVEIEFTQVEKL
ncbi:transcription termination/antitermination protein NusG [Candidatus Desantisbacteria bacterium CG_4_10_14_0_8_um_filter_48_22]|uniref:Transcription termination/antitermination protein NusG n=1 Tax=Candidatus Desantisbacteria bacterium CG_4_10_14_0_8_um_filter_48_22 TaxID=1974543 RepID=A0A2M7SA76_9BACT|nr:MAG: transcription termination/antitermination factor NusG [Candidatus Desantisbacteria bacterium CG1_02_49_89]PIV54693.1 MAG: transcription termination/antitermination protein NusG [Candidatus Desantisbacteria bacterium CG02_land_8_20_14_3_00_49_13]PIZ16193.1 MAG: transcription termination/antitermination protein NusG [Candidatus Desantisbacteria bacterium CG_4_10_14_0_8_um_filter_48_22]